jgi:glycosyltransferase involved in cell wall biosynthesis
MSNSPFFTVIVPVYNRADLVGETIESVLSQKYADFELILVDDGSQDNSVEVMEGYAKTDGRIRILKLDKNEGRCFARNQGLLNAHGTWICYLDSDDTYYSNHLQTFHNLIHSHPTFSVFATEQNENGEPKKYNRKWLQNNEIELSFSDFIEDNPLSANQICHRYDLNLKWSDQKISISEDWLFLRELALKYSVKKVSIATNNVRFHSNRTMRTIDAKTFAYYNVLGAELFLRNNSVKENYQNRIKAYTHLLCTNVFLSSHDKKNAWVQFRLSLKYLVTYSYALFYKAILKFILPTN